MDDERAEWKKMGSTPVSAEVPAGEAVRYDPDFELLQSEVQKLENLSGGSVDWDQVVALSREILRSKSKDLLVSSYLAMGLLETKGLAGLSGGLACVEGMVSEFWPNLFPAKKRMRARINALNWLSEKAGAVIARQEPSQKEAEVYAACSEQVKALEALLEEKMGPDAPGLTDLHRPVQEHLDRLSAGVADTPETEVQREPEVKPATRTVAGPVASIESPDDAKRALRDSVSILKRVISYRRNQDLTSPLSYRLIRSLTWCEIDTLPPADNGKSRIPPPPGHLRKTCQSLFEQSAWKELLSQVESKVAEFPFWLDLHRFSEMALAALGPDYGGARRAVRVEVSAFVDRLPDLLDYQFSDGTPFCDEETQRWVSTVFSVEKQPEPAEILTVGDGDEFLNELRKQSRSLLKEGKQDDAVRLVQDEMRSAPNQRRRFLVQLEMARLCREVGQTKVALAHLESLDELISEFSLEIWEPVLSQEVLQAYWTVLRDVLRKSKQGTSDMSQRADAVYSRLCRLDVLAGLKLTKKK